MSRIIIIENSGKVNFGGGQKITLQVAEILSKTCELVFVDFVCRQKQLCLFLLSDDLWLPGHVVRRNLVRSRKYLLE